MGLLSPAKEGDGTPSAYLSPLGAWSLAVGSSIGWGSFIITSNTYLHDAGPLGSVLGLLVGTIAMVVIARNYHYLMGRYPDAGGVYSYAKNAFGYDHGFLTAWFVGLTYLAIFWANATSVPLFARYFLGDVFRFGYLFSPFGYDVYFGEVLLTLVTILVAAAVCICSKRLAGGIVIVLALGFTVCLAVCFAGAIFGFQSSTYTADPAFAPGGNAFNQVLAIACISPWAFIGFENISHSAGEFSFSQRLSFRIMAMAVIIVGLLYVFVILLSVTAYPPQFDSWFSYIDNLGTLQGIEGLPVFYAAHHYLGDMGVALLYFALFSLIGTSLIGQITALSRLLMALSRDGVLSGGLQALNDRGVPYRAILAVALVSCIIPFLGRTAIGWIVDVTTIGAAVTYGFVSAATLREARNHGNRIEQITGTIGLIAMVIIGVVITLPNLFAAASMATESFFIFTLWSLLGLAFFLAIHRRDPDNRFGESVIVWIALLAFVMFMSFVWIEQSSEEVADTALADLQAYYQSGEEELGADFDPDAYYQERIAVVRQTNIRDMLVVLCVFAIALGILISNFSYMRKKERESVLQLGMERLRANTDALTGVKSKHVYAEKEYELDFAIAHGVDVEFAIVVCDLNGMKEVNDTFGHSVGDEYIKEACKFICVTYKHSPVYRIGGDEFAVVLQGDDYRNREELEEAINEQVEVNATTGGPVLAVGVAAYDPQHDASALEVFKRADERMYARKCAMKGEGAARR